MKKAIIATLVLGLLAVAVFLVYGRVGGGEAQLEKQTAVIDPAVLDALEKDDEVEVIIQLKLPDVPLAQATLDEFKANTAARQARVLAALPSSDFTLLRQYEVAAALFGRITESGIETLRSHEDVIGVGVDIEIFGGIQGS